MYVKDTLPRHVFGANIGPALAKRLRAATDKGRNPLAPTKADVLRMGLVMALTKLEKRKKA